MCICCDSLYQFPPRCSSEDGILLRGSCFFAAGGGKTEPVFEFGLAPFFLGASLRYAHPGRRDWPKAEDSLEGVP